MYVKFTPTNSKPCTPYQPTSTKAVTPNTPEPTDTSKLVQNGKWK